MIIARKPFNNFIYKGLDNLLTKDIVKYVGVRSLKIFARVKFLFSFEKRSIVSLGLADIHTCVTVTIPS